MGTTAWYLLIFKHPFAVVMYYMLLEESQRKYIFLNVTDYHEWCTCAANDHTAQKGS